MEYLFKVLKKRANEVTAKPRRYTDYYSTCINHGFVKLQQYHRKLDDSRLYYAATALNPCRRFTYFEREWANKPGGRKEIANARQWTQELFDEYLSRLAPPLLTPPDELNSLFIGLEPEPELDTDDEDDRL
jgi:hypothetical protein